MSYNSTALACKLTVVFIVLSSDVDPRKMRCKMWKDQMLNFNVNSLKKDSFPLCSEQPSAYFMNRMKLKSCFGGQEKEINNLSENCRPLVG